MNHILSRVWASLTGSFGTVQTKGGNRGVRRMGRFDKVRRGTSKTQIKRRRARSADAANEFRAQITSNWAAHLARQKARSK